MEGAGFALAQSLRQQMAPVVMVLPTPKVEASCQRNSLSFVDLLTPFCSLANVNGMYVVTHNINSHCSYPHQNSHIITCALRTISRGDSLHAKSALIRGCSVQSLVLKYGKDFASTSLTYWLSGATQR